MDKVLIIGAHGQLGVELTHQLRKLKGANNVLATDLRETPTEALREGPYEQLDILDTQRFHALIDLYEIKEVYHLAAILSAKGEQNPPQAWQLNMESLITVLEAGRNKLNKVYWPSSIAIFGPDTPKENTPQHTLTNPTTVYGISKLAGEKWCAYYFKKYGVDVRSLRYPGLIGHKTLPGGGTTDYAVDIFHKAIAGEAYECFLAPDTLLPMMYMEDAVKATLDLMEAPASAIKLREAYNIASLSFTPAQIAEAIRTYYPDFEVTYRPDFRQEIAETWPHSLDDGAARSDWGWQPQYHLGALVDAMIAHLKTSIAFHS